MELPADLFSELAEGARFERVIPGSGAEKRTAARVQISMEASILRLNAGPNVKPMSAQIRDLSSRGIGIECGERFHVTEMFAIRFLRQDGTPVWVQCEVTRWLPVAQDRFAIGAKFEKLLTGAKADPKSTAA